jgi:D-alanyl-D-alanine carboxypeptidase
MRSWIVSGVLIGALSGSSETRSPDLAARIDELLRRPELGHALVGIEIYSLADRRVLYTKNEHKLFVSGSVAKVVTEGAALELLGAERRFQTGLYGAGPVTPEGTLEGDSSWWRAATPTSPTACARTAPRLRGSRSRLRKGAGGGPRSRRSPAGHP